MTSRVVACAGGGCTDGHMAAWLWLLVLAAVSAIGFAGWGYDQRRKRAGRPPREPVADLRPSMMSFLMARPVTGYTAPVRAVTPRGITVARSRCCDRGHQSPAQAVKHAAAVAALLETRGR